MGLHVTDLHDKGLDSIISFQRYASCEDNRVVRLLTEPTWPEFCCFNVRRVDHELLAGDVKVCGCFEACNIRAMAKLSLCVTPDDVEVICLRKEVSFLLVRSECDHGTDEHLVMESEWSCSCKHETPADSSFAHLRFFRDIVLQVLRLEHEAVAPPPLDHLIASALLVVLDAGVYLRVLLLNLIDLIYILNLFCSKNERCELILVEVALGAFFKQIGVDDLVLNASTQRLCVKLWQIRHSYLFNI